MIKHYDNYTILQANSFKREQADVLVSTFYKLVELDENYLPAFKDEMVAMLKSMGVLGTIHIATEGINGTITIKEADLKNFYEFLAKKDKFRGILYKEHTANDLPFEKLKIKIKPEVVSFGVDTKALPGDYLNPEAWDDMISKNETILIDVRNDYECYVGAFQKAINPNTRNFREFATWVDNNLKDEDKNKNIAMYCTAGIRVEKASRYLKKLGFNNVYQLEGGIVGYLATGENVNNKWVGDCFVFDNRLIVNDKLESDN